jgi:hypothetical protein
LILNIFHPFSTIVHLFPALSLILPLNTLN